MPTRPNRLLSRSLSASAFGGWAVASFSALLGAAAVAGAVRDHTSGRALWSGGSSVGLGAEIALLASGLGAYLLTRHPGHRLGVVFLASGFVWAVLAAADQWTTHALRLPPRALPGGGVTSWVGQWAKIIPVGLAAVTVLLFPDGQLSGRRRAFIWLSTVGVLVGSVVPAVALWPLRGPQLLHLSLPAALTAGDGRLRAAGVGILAGLVLVLLTLCVGVGGLARRALTESRTGRAQAKWLAFGVVLNVAFTAAGLVKPATAPLRLVGPVVLMGCIAVAVFRYRLFDIDRLISRTLVYGALCVILGLVYATLVIGAADLVGSSRHSAVAVAGATLVAAALFAPLRSRLQLSVDRCFDRRTYEALTRVRAFVNRLGEDRPQPGAFERMLSQVLRDPDLTVYFSARSGGLLDARGMSVAPPYATGAQLVTPVEHNGVRLGLVVHSAALDAEPAVLPRVLKAATAAFEHARLLAELGAQLAEVQASRARVVQASDDARRRVERDLHDGAQQRLVALALGIRADQRRLQVRLDPRVGDVLDQAVSEIQQAVEELRELASGVMPATLMAGGLTSAVAELIRRTPTPVTIEELPRHRMPPPVELTAWFVLSEAFANALKHAPGSALRVHGVLGDKALTLAVSDDGPGGARIAATGGLRGLADRVEARGGCLRLSSQTGLGTVLAVEIPCE